MLTLETCNPVIISPNIVFSVLWDFAEDSWKEQTARPLSQREQNTEVVRHLTFCFLPGQELPVRASAYMDNALRPLHQLLTDATGLVNPSTAHDWLRVALSDCTQR